MFIAPLVIIMSSKAIQPAPADANLLVTDCLVRVVGVAAGNEHR